jgi:hypothetical protein
MKLITPSRPQFSLAVLLGLALAVMATPGTAWSSLRDDVRDFHLFMRDHPRIAAHLRANPNLVVSRRYLDNHEDLARFLRRRPALRDEIRYNPGRVFGSYYRYDRSDRYDRYGRWR